jgi:elongator complex protein 6
MASRIPHLLEAYLALPPESSLILLTNVLGATTNWLVLRYLYSFLKASNKPLQDGNENDGTQETRVVLLSFLRDYAFWKEGAGRLVRITPRVSVMYEVVEDRC